MLVIAKASDSTYICQVNHDELEKFMNKYYGKMEKLKVGEEVNLGLGYNYAYKIEDACEKMTQAMKSFDQARATMTSFALALSKNKGENE